jgi:integrase/recombinase XerD
MLETLRQVPFFLNRHRDAPLLEEREMFLRHLQQQGTSRASLQTISNELLHVIRLLRLSTMREVSLEIRGAAKRFVFEEQSNPRARSYRCTGTFFIYAAKK